jgi:hypothetical protein
MGSAARRSALRCVTEENGNVAMILRRFSANLRRQDWTAVVVELAVVVIGVFIGLQASNWNQERETDGKAAHFAESLKADMRAEAWGYEYQIHYYGNVLSNAERTVDALTGRAPLADEALLISAFRATQYNENIRRRATYDELTSTGTIGLIRDPVLRETAMQLYTTNNFNNIVQEGRSSPYRLAFRMAIANDVQRSLEKTCGDRVAAVGDYKTNFADAINYPCSTGLPADTIAESVAALRNDPKLVPVLRLRVANLESNVANLLVYEGGIHAALRGFTEQAK